MTNHSFDTCLAFCQRAEGGYSADPLDPGNWFNGILIGSSQGISARVLAEWLHPAAITAQDMKNLAPDTVTSIFRTHYWAPCQADTLPSGADLMVVDHAYNTGVQSSLRLYNLLQDQTVSGLLASLCPNTMRLLQAHLGLARDGICGPKTQAAANADRQSLLLFALAAAQERFYRNCRQFPHFGAGWLNRLSARLTVALQIRHNVFSKKDFS